MYRKILLTHDGSEVASAAIPHAQTLAEATGAPIVVLQAIDSVQHILAETASSTFEPGFGVGAEIAEETVSGERAAAQRNLAAVKAQLEAAGVTDVSVVIAEGPAAETIVQVAADQQCDIIVIATHGRSGLGRVVLGSVAEHVARHARDAAVLLVRVRHD